MSGNKQNANIQKEDIASIKKDEKNKKILLAIVTGVVIITIVLSFHISEKIAISKQDYIDGNIIRMANNNGSAEGDIIVGNPWRNANIIEMLIYRSVFITDSTFSEINPSLAQKYELLDDDVTYVITMRDNQFWSDGEPITADDILFSFEGFLQCESVNSNLSASFNRIVGAEEYSSGEADTIEGITIEGNQIIIELKSPYSNFALMLTQFVPLPKHILENEDLSTLTSDHEFFINANPICSGEFHVQSVDEYNNLILEKNPYYTDKATDIETIMVCWDYDNEVIDYYATTDPSKMVSNRSMKGFEEYPIGVYFYRYFVFNIAGGDEGEPNANMQDEKVRQAIYHAIDTELLMKEIYFNKTTPVYGGSLELSKQLYEYNPEKAKELLESAEYDFDRVFTIAYYSSDSSTSVMLEKIAEQLEAVGLTVELFQASASEIYATPTYDMLLKNLSALNIEDWYSEYLSNNANLSQLMGREGEFDDLIYQLTSTNDSDDYQSILKELVDLEQELLYKMPLFLLNDAVFINSNRLSVPEDIVFGNTRYRSDIRIDEWFVIKQ